MSGGRLTVEEFDGLMMACIDYDMALGNLRDVGADASDGSSEIDDAEDSVAFNMAELIGRLLRHRRVLIESARPNCGRCGGYGEVDTLDGGGSVRSCPDCDGTGWAA